MIKNNSSYKYPIFFFALIALISFCEISNSDPRADQCAATITNAGGNWQYCSTQPATQILTFYKVAFCTAQPTVPTSTTATGMTSCSTVFENTAGSPVSIVKGIGTTPSGTFSAPPYGDYTFAYIELSHVITYKANLVFTGTSGSTKARSSTNTVVAPALPANGPNCHTNGETDNYYFGNLRGITCTGDVVGVAVNSNVIVNSFDDNTEVYGAIVDEGVTVGTHIYLIQSNGTLASGSALNALAAGANKVAKLIFLLPININVTPNTTKGYNLKYNNTRGMDVLQLQNGANFNVGLSAAYFDMTLELQ